MADCAIIGPVWGQRSLSPTQHLNLQTLGKDKVVVDTQTGLMWQHDNLAPAVGFKLHMDACEGLKLGGYDDWRAPTIVEMESIFDYTQRIKGVYVNDKLFPETNARQHATWPLKSTSKTLWQLCVNPSLGFINYGCAGANMRCVRTHKLVVPKSPRYVVDKSGDTVVDQWLEIAWQVKSGSGDWMSNSGSVKFCEKLELGGAKGWRLPTIRELWGSMNLHASGKKGHAYLAEPLDPAEGFGKSSGNNLMLAASADGLDAFMPQRCMSVTNLFTKGGHGVDPHFFRCVRTLP